MYSFSSWRGPVEFPIGHVNAQIHSGGSPRLLTRSVCVRAGTGLSQFSFRAHEWAFNSAAHSTNLQNLYDHCMTLEHVLCVCHGAHMPRMYVRVGVCGSSGQPMSYISRSRVVPLTPRSGGAYVTHDLGTTRILYGTISRMVDIRKPVYI